MTDKTVSESKVIFNCCILCFVMTIFPLNSSFWYTGYIFLEDVHLFVSKKYWFARPTVYWHEQCVFNSAA